MAVTETICRSCMAEVLLSDTHSINRIGWDIITFKQMFETALGYQITISEPQQFCVACARTLIQWYEFKSRCQTTQEMLTQVKLEPELHSETIWYVKNEPVLPENTEPEHIPMETEDTETGNQVFTIQLNIILRKYFFAKLRNGVSLGELKITGTSSAEANQQIWSFIKPHLKREICFDNENKPIWHEDETPQATNLTHFIMFKDLKARKTFEYLSYEQLVLWTNRPFTLYVYPYSKNIMSVIQWNMAKKALINKNLIEERKKITKQLQTVNEPDESIHKLLTAEELKVRTENVIKDLVTQLKLRHENKFPETQEINWKTWAYYINSFSKEKYEGLINETPPTQLLPFFDPKLDLFPEITTKDTPETYSLSLVMRLKFIKLGQGTILGRFTITGSTLDDFKHSIWIKVRPYLAREANVANDNEMPSWSVNVTPTESDLHKFVTIFDPKSRRTNPFNTLTDDLFQRFSKRRTLFMNIYPFSSAVSSAAQLNYIEKSLLEIKRCYATTRVVEKLKELHEFVSFDWKMWAHYIQAHESSEQEMLMRQEPPRELAHLFITKSLQNLSEPDEDEVDKEKNSSNTMSPEALYALAPLSREEIADTSKLKKCPFPGCSSLVKTSFLAHMRYCKHNPNREFIYRCPFEGCSQSYSFRRYQQRHIRYCKHNPNRKILPLQKCPHCSVLTRHLRAHIYNTHSNREYVCHLCGTVLRTKASIELHILRIHKQMKYICDKCPYEYKTSQALKKHVKRDHAEKPLELNYKCEQCSYATHDRNNYSKHVKYRHDENYKKPECPVCGKTQTTKRLLRLHMLTHADTEFNCNVCSHVSKTEKGLKCHMTLHEEWKYECPVCFIKRRSAPEVRMHCKRKHPDYKLPPKGTVMKTTSKRHGKRSVYYPEDDESSQNI